MSAVQSAVQSAAKADRPSASESGGDGARGRSPRGKQSAANDRRVLTESQIESYHRDGYLTIPDFVGPEACAALRQRAIAIVDEWVPSERKTVFTTNEQERASNEEFFHSASSTWCFFETEALDADGNLVVDKARSINKIGHATHDLDDVFESFTYTSDLAGVAHDVGMTAPLALQSMYIFKQPLIGGEVSCHQDSTFLFTEPLSVTGFWFALEDATVDNGCLWAAPGGHRTPLRKVFRRRDADGTTGTTFQTLDDAPLPSPPTDLVPLEVTAGTMVVLHGLLPHWSDVNRSARSRHAYSVHCIEEQAVYPDWNWLQRRTEMPLRRLDQVVSSPHTVSG